MTQNEALDILKLGHNVYLTGPAGSGKTYLLNQYIAYLKEYKIPVGVTASTGIAATHMGGTTIHSWSGMGIRDAMTASDMAELFKRQYLRNRFFHTKVLIIDEISMLHAYQLDLVHAICSAFKRVNHPFGGMQVIMCGDFFQLPPVQKTDHRNSLSAPFLSQQQLSTENPEEFAPPKPKNNFVTESEIWNMMKLQICYLNEQHRQDDRSFLRVLNDIRNGEVSEMTVEYLSDRLNKETEGFTKPTRLFTHNADVDAINAKHLAELAGEDREYFMQWRGSINLVESLKKSCLAPEKLVLKKGAQVMFVKNNYEAGYVNGTLGEVIDFTKDGPLVRTFDGSEIVVSPQSWEVKEDAMQGSDPEVKAAISQFPLRLAWAITIHKSQGMSLDAAEIDLSRAFVPGMGYVALSRVRSLQGLKLMGMNQMALQVNPDVAEIDRAFHERSEEAVSDIRMVPSEKKDKLHKDYLAFLLGKQA